VFVAYGAVAFGGLIAGVAAIVAVIAAQVARDPALARDPAAVGAAMREMLATRGFLFATLAGSATILAVVALSAARLSREPLRIRLALASSALPPSALAVAVLGAVALSSTFDAGFGALGLEPTGTLRFLGRAIASLTPGGLVLVLLLAGLAAPLAEELFFRGYVQTRLCRRWGTWPGILTGAAMFGLMHLDQIHTPSSFIIGVYLGWLAARSGSIRPGIVAHAANNTLWAVATFAGLGNGLPRGAHAALLVLYVSATAAAVVWLRPRFAESRAAIAGSQPAEATRFPA
jgi:hypothetical protein